MHTCVFGSSMPRSRPHRQRLEVDHVGVADEVRGHRSARAPHVHEHAPHPDNFIPGAAHDRPEVEVLFIFVAGEEDRFEAEGLGRDNCVRRRADMDFSGHRRALNWGANSNSDRGADMDFCGCLLDRGVDIDDRGIDVNFDRGAD
ncbi:MAG: hypothetical protein EBU23_07505 [Mycobacteriaceae bacterium]|nr:hypothetical protein [Mycobacteriaceae bacterium]